MTTVRVGPDTDMAVIAGSSLGESVSVYPGVAPRLLEGGGAWEDLGGYRTGGGYRPVVDDAALVDEIDAAGLRGRGGAGFPAAVKLRTVRAARTATVTVANGEEGEPASVKDRWLLRNRPHLVLDGLRLAAHAAGSSTAYVYLSDSAAHDRVTEALAELAKDPQFTLDVSVVRVEAGYVAGEESAAVRAINGGPALPTDKPPRPFEEGVSGLPTLINNVETLAQLAMIHRLGAAEYRRVGTSGSSGTFLMTLTVSGVSSLREVPFGVTVREVLEWSGHDVRKVRGFLMGGYFAGVIGPRALDLTLDYDEFVSNGTGLGCGAVVVIDEDMCPVAAASAVMTYFGRENANQCGSCFNGTSAMAAVLESVCSGHALDADIDRLRYWSTFLRGRGACGTLDGATNIAATLLREFPAEVDMHLHGTCDICIAHHIPEYPPFAVSMASTHREDADR